MLMNALVWCGAACALATEVSVNADGSLARSVRPHDHSLSYKASTLVDVPPVIPFDLIQGYDVTAPEYQEHLARKRAITRGTGGRLTREARSHDRSESSGEVTLIGAAFTQVQETLGRKGSAKEPAPPVGCQGRFVKLNACTPCMKIAVEWEETQRSENGGALCTMMHPDKKVEVVLRPGDRQEVDCECDCEGYWELGMCHDCKNREDTFHEMRKARGGGKPCSVADLGKRTEECTCTDCEGEWVPVRKIECVDCGTEYEYRHTQHKTGGGKDCPFTDGFRKTDCEGIWADEEPAFRCKPENNCGTEEVPFIVKLEPTNGGECQQRGETRAAECSEKIFSCNKDCEGDWEYSDGCMNDCNKRVEKTWFERQPARGNGKKCPFKRGQKLKEKCTCEVDCVGAFTKVQKECDCANGVTSRVLQFEIETPQGGTGKQCDHSETDTEEEDCACDPGLTKAAQVNLGAANTLVPLWAGVVALMGRARA